jgi:Baseplate J-like protein
MTNHLQDDRQRFVASTDKQEAETNAPQEGIQDIYVLIVREHEEVEEYFQVVDSSPVLAQKTSMLPAYAICCIYFLLIVSTLAFQFYCMVNPPVATITIIPASQTVTLVSTMQLGRVLPPLTISQSQTVPTTGKGHQDAKAATGFITLYNGQFQNVTIAAGTILTGASGIQVVTDQDADIPAANPPAFGQVTVSAHAMKAGIRGNIPASDINQACCATSVLVKNTQPFYGGQDERTYTTVTHNDIHSVSTVLKTTIAQSITGALQGQHRSQEQLQLLPCTPTVSSNHQPGDEATQVKVTVSETCSAVAYNNQALAAKAATFLATKARHKAGAGYSLFGTVHINVTQASVTNTTKPLVFLSFKASGTWIYALSQQSQQQIKHRIAGKTTQQAVKMLASLPGVKQAAIRCSGFGDVTKLPKQSSDIHLAIIVV